METIWYSTKVEGLGKDLRKRLVWPHLLRSQSVLKRGSTWTLRWDCPSYPFDPGLDLTYPSPTVWIYEKIFLLFLTKRSVPFAPRRVPYRRPRTTVHRYHSRPYRRGEAITTGKSDTSLERSCSQSPVGNNPDGLRNLDRVKSLIDTPGGFHQYQVVLWERGTPPPSRSPRVRWPFGTPSSSKTGHIGWRGLGSVLLRTDPEPQVYRSL